MSYHYSPGTMFHYPGHVMGYMHTVHSGIPTPSSHISALRVEALYAFRQHSWDHHPSCPVARVPTDARDNGSPDCIACPMYSLLLDQHSALVVGARTAFRIALLHNPRREYLLEHGSRGDILPERMCRDMHYTTNILTAAWHARVSSGCSI